MWTFINIVTILLLLWLAWFCYKKLVGTSTPKSLTPDVVGYIPTKTQTFNVVRSKYFPDRLYVGKLLKLDSTIKYLFTNVMFSFPDSALIVKGFKYFDIDGNQFEQIDFERIGKKEYMILNDTFENNIYFLNRVMSVTVDDGTVPPMACQDVIELTENNETYTYEDMSGLIEVQVSQDHLPSDIDRLIRVYERKFVEDLVEDSEYLICIMDNPKVVHYYIGCIIGMPQLEDI